MMRNAPSANAMSVAAATAQPRRLSGSPKVERDIEEHGDCHPSCGRNAREKAPGPGGEFAVDKLALDLKRPTSWKKTAIRPSFIQ
jgi:hypothetical protein